jgi:hypothetical protein
MQLDNVIVNFTRSMTNYRRMTARLSLRSGLESDGHGATLRQRAAAKGGDDSNDGSAAPAAADVASRFDEDRTASMTRVESIGPRTSGPAQLERANHGIARGACPGMRSGRAGAPVAAGANAATHLYNRIEEISSSKQLCTIRGNSGPGGTRPGMGSAAPSRQRAPAPTLQLRST